MVFYKGVLYESPELSGLMFGSVGMLMLQGLSDKKIIKLGSEYFIKKISPHIPLYETILRDLEGDISTPNDKDIVRAIGLIR